MANTRFCPNLNGGLHLGHLFTLLVNEHIAHSTGGKLSVRFDDTCYVSTRMGIKMDTILQGQLEDIDWLGIDVDKFVLQSQLIYEARDILRDSGFKYPAEDEAKGYKLATSLRQDNQFLMYPYCSRQTPERVIMDHMMDITHLIRGEDFLTEVSYYGYICEMLDYPIPEFWCLPRLASGRGDISKTNGGYTITEFRANGYEPEELKDKLASACLSNPPNGWNFYNIKHNPVWGA